jgi:Tol biopolymer transport system component
MVLGTVLLLPAIASQAQVEIIKSPNVGRIKQLTFETDDYWPRFSPDGKKIVFYSKRTGNRDIFAMNIDGSGLQQLTTHQAEDKDPDWSHDGSKIVWASAQSGNFDIWIMNRDGSGKRNLTNSPEDETWPRWSPIEFGLYEAPMDEGLCPYQSIWTLIPTIKYHKILYEKTHKKKSQIWVMLDDGRFPVQLSPPHQNAHHPSWSTDGLHMVYDAEEGERTTVWRGDYLVFDNNEKYAGKECENLDDCPKEFVRFPAKQIAGAAENFSRPSYSANGIELIVCKYTSATESAVWTLRIDGTQTQQCLDNPGFDFCPAWRSDGRYFAFTSQAKGTSNIYLAESKYYLSDVVNLYRYPEIFNHAPIDKLAQNRFVVVPDEEKEFFHPLEKARYKEQDVFVSIDPLLQLYHDIFREGLKEVEIHYIIPRLRKLTETLFVAVQQKFQSEPAPRQKESYADLLEFLVVPYYLLNTLPPLPEEYLEAEERSHHYKVDHEHESGASQLTLSEWLSQKLPLQVEIQNFLQKSLQQIDSHSGIVELKSGMLLDYSQFKPRGYYNENAQLQQYFKAMMWYGTCPVPLDANVLALYQIMQERDLTGLWDEIDQSMRIFAGSPEDACFVQLHTIKASHPALLKLPASEPQLAALSEKIQAMIKPAIFSPTTAVQELARQNTSEAQTKKVIFYFMPQRSAPDADIVTNLVAPKIRERSLPKALDVFAAMGSQRAFEIIRDRLGEGKEDYFSHYEDNLDLMRNKFGKPDPAFWQQDLYKSWLEVLKAVAVDNIIPSPLVGELPPFSTSLSWRDRLLFVALASYTELKHDTILYYKMPYGAECGDGAMPLFLRERPIPEEPIGYVEPHPAFYRSMSGLLISSLEHAKKINVKLDIFGKLLQVVGELERLSLKEINSEPLTAEEYRWIRRFGGLLEEFYLQGYNNSRLGPERLERGISLVADVATNVIRKQVCR